MSPVVFVSDASAEAERVSDTLRSAGYVVVDVPLSMLSSRVSAQRPNVVLVDVDADGGLDELARLRRVPGSAAIDFIYIGGGEGVVKNLEDALSNDGSAFFLRPVDIGALVRKLEALTGGAGSRPEVRLSTPPPSLGVNRRRPSSPPSYVPPSDRPSAPSLPAPGVRTPGPPLPMSTTSLADLIESPRSLASFGSVSHELQQLLADAELRAEAMSSPEAAMPSPEEEIEAVLPADVLASLDEPLDGDDDEEQGGEGGPRVGASSGSSAPAHDREGTGAHAKGTTAGGSRQITTGAGLSGRPPSTGSQTRERRATGESAPRAVTAGGSATRPPTGTSPSHAPSANAPSGAAGSNAPSGSVSSGSVSTTPAGLGRPRTTEALSSSASYDPSRAAYEARTAYEASRTQETTRSDSVRRPHLPHAPTLVNLDDAPTFFGAGLPSPSSATVLGPSDAPRFFAEAVARRATGALCFESDGVVRRIVMREGDLVAAASGGELESLVHFLGARGELPRDEAPRLAAKIPPYGRHAGAALVAHGWLRQDQLWQVLRAHAEWIASAVLRLTRGTAQLEPDPPGRLRGEPSVFGAATGAEIFVDLVRRAVPHEVALERLSGEASRITEGPNHGLLVECNLPAQDLELLHRTRGGTVADLLARATDGEILAVVHALGLLGVVEIVPAPDFGRRRAEAGREGSNAREREGSDPEVAALDEEAIRSRVRARLELVEDGDYFAVLGVTRDATGYEIRRAFIELRRAFEPSRILTPHLVDLSGDVRKIVIVLEEAYEILRDNARRERYRRAIDARPE